VPLREPTADELRLLSFLADGSPLPARWVRSLRVEDMDDGGMGSLRLYPTDPPLRDRQLGRVLAAARFEDADGVPVIATLYANRSGEPFELDMWKTDFQPLKGIAASLELLQDS